MAVSGVGSVRGLCDVSARVVPTVRSYAVHLGEYMGIPFDRGEGDHVAVIQLRGVSHMDSDAARVEVDDCYPTHVISDECAATIASWFQSPGTDGAAFAALASGAECDVDALKRDIASAKDSLGAVHSGTMVADHFALDALLSWAAHKASTVHLD